MENMYEIRLCNADELDELQRFIREKWNENHIFARNADLLRWQHFNKDEGKFNFIVAYNKKTKNFDAVLGFIPTWHFDGRLRSKTDIWFAIWKSDKERAEQKGLGTELVIYLENVYKPNSLSNIGVSEIGKMRLISHGYKTGALSHYYIVNPYLSKYNLIETRENSDKKKTGIDADRRQSCLKEITDLRKTGKLASAFRPEKSIDYLINRFSKHPIYKYRFYGAYESDKLESILVIRKVTVDNDSCLRIVDVLGRLEGLPSLREELAMLLYTEGAEYIDCLNFGIDESVFYSLGFLKRTGDVTIPNYFEPFEKATIDIQVAFKTVHKDYVVFKADAEQDRPNR